MARLSVPASVFGCFMLLVSCIPAAIGADRTDTQINALIESYGKGVVIEVVQKERYGQITVMARQQMKQMWGRPQADLVSAQTLAHDLAQLGYDTDTLEQRIQSHIAAQEAAIEKATAHTDYFSALRERQRKNALLYRGTADINEYERALARDLKELEARLQESERDQKALERMQKEEDLRKMRIAAGRGQITHGMPFDLVRQAWGPPSSVNHGLHDGQRATTWYYRKENPEEYRLIGEAYVYFGADGYVVSYSVPTSP